MQQTLPAGTLAVPVTPATGRLAFALLEPRSDDGVVAWNLLDEHIEASAFLERENPLKQRRPQAPSP